MEENIFSEKEVSPSETVTRFIFQKSYYRSSDNTVRHNAFMPNRDGLTSVYRTVGLEDSVILNMGRDFVVGPLNKPLIGRADIGVPNILKCNLNVMPETIPHKRHANICNWPTEQPEQKVIALELAAEANLHLI